MVQHAHDAVEPDAVAETVRREGDGDAGRLGHAAGFEQDVFGPLGPVDRLDHRIDEIIADGATDAVVGEADDVAFNGDDEVSINLDGAKVVDEHRHAQPVVAGQDAVVPRCSILNRVSPREPPCDQLPTLILKRNGRPAHSSRRYRANTMWLAPSFSAAAHVEPIDRTATPTSLYCYMNSPANSSPQRWRWPDIAYDVLLETGIHVQRLPIWEEEWKHPEAYSTPLLRHIERDGIRLGTHTT
jgi:hypothetical protein